MGDPVLVELDDDPGAPAPESPAGPARRRWGALVLLAVVVVLVLAQLVADAREGARLAALTHVTGVLDPQPDPPRVAWRLHDDATGDVQVVGSRLLEGRIAPDGAMSVAARDLTTGAVRWTAPLLDAPDPPLPAGTVRYGLQCTAGPTLPGRVVCLVHDATVAGTLEGPPATSTSEPATSARVEVVDAASGEVVADHAAVDDGNVAAAVGVTDGALVLAAPLDDGTTVWALDPATGAQRWRVRADTGFGGGWLRWGAEVRVVPVGDTAVGVLGAGAVLLDVADGSTLATAGTLATVTGARQDGTALVVGSEGYTRLVGPAGEVRLEGAPVPVDVDDGSVPGLALTTSGGLRAWDARTGEPRWRADVPGQVALVVGGCLHVYDAFHVTTLDARTGEVLWETTAPELLGGDAAVTGVATDGSHLLVAGATPTTGPRLVAVDPADGTVQWRTDRSGLDGVMRVDEADGVLLGVGPQGTVVLR
ncbi:outer membrane protein assembly factor BamB family protein [Cellulomonas dongxiuzhuiae]|uniref:PQQ-binding-like beta-propeller repeat protein n=1 Tax=Cellulomonas dongxiuzhuiae TaxID=2819979 RepID=A0ABX8GIW9_9CELL|nr:PQQ-binding-like beta-propeller repeat protein [Cellulomonas dongxiuzhuiae]MBO3095150.1 PQQ-binding-like beta-propeller repeat protein [Cellulomonas dongxiuzhuiae]QWC16154.1 PQQ-binding-like beta-propeller repeat protein [Cellulomonas dongxiuzhuiae]